MRNRFVLAMVAIGFGCHESPEPSATPMPRTERPANEATEPAPPSYPGVTLSARRLEVRAPSTATIVSVEVDHGDTVREGDVLVVLDSADASADLRVATADLRALERERASAQLAAKVARRRRTNVHALYGDGFAPADGVAEAELDADHAASQVERLDAQIEAMKTRIARLRALVEEHRLRASMDGVVAERLVDAGSVVGPSTTIVRLVAEHADRVRFAIEPDDRASFRSGLEVQLRATTGVSLGTATVQSVAPEVDPAANALFVDATLDDDHDLPVGFAVWVDSPGDDR